MGVFSKIIEYFTQSSKGEERIDRTIDIRTKFILHREFIALDIVTTGPSPEVDRIIEIAAVRMSGRVLVERFSTVINPCINISQKISWRTGISNEQVLAAPTIRLVLPGLKEFIKDCPVIVENAAVVMQLVNRNLPGTEVITHDQIHDILTLSKNYLKDVVLRGYSYTIPELSEYIGHKSKDRKGAFENAVTIAAIYNKIYESVDDKVIPAFLASE